jgi:acyl carrier protein phosphodiesterase
VNYLAHLYLADPTPESMLGNVMADFVKGRAVDALPEAVRAGVLLHRQVDRFTDSHPVTNRSIGRVKERWGWYSGILIDVFYDHFLALDWDRYSPQTLRSFIDTAHAALLSRQELMTAEMRAVVQRMVRDDRLMSYGRLDGIEQTLLRISRLIRRRQANLERAMDDLRQHFDALRGDFHDFFPELIAFVNARKEAEASSLR